MQFMKILATAAFGLAALTTSALATEPATETLGDGVSVSEATSIAAILAEPDTYLGKVVRIEGKVLDVCPMKGCWMELGEADQTLRVKVEDDVIVFPADSKGRIAAAQGKVVARELSRDQYIGWLKHLAEEKGETLDTADLEIGEGPHRIIQIEGTGARIGVAGD